jgi:hypothetical protein
LYVDSSAPPTTGAFVNSRLKTLIGRGFGYFLIMAIIIVGIFVGARLAIELAMLCFIGFLLSEIFLNKNVFYSRYDRANTNHSFSHVWKGAKAEGTKPAMRKIFLQSDDGSDFTVLIGFRLGQKFHCFGAMQSKHGKAVMNTWMGKGRCEFCFMATIPASKITTSHGDLHQTLEAQETFWPHWYQQWPFYFFG